ncbi:uncharacterized protein LOC107305350 [Oryza brachyantha]|uniref:uncharacterized protein LOC107305350 n=1 Tax=Oryza brachyantha TaxID=4533 RepID=UPI001ADBBE67|nr:uncharacterized protein LOC107305350 [Oryza brachyantha]
MAALEASATTYQEITTATAAAAATAAGERGQMIDDGEDQRGMIVPDDSDDDDELFELDIALIDHRDGEEYSRRALSGGAGGDEQGDALLANCLLPVSSVSKAVPVTDSGFVVVSSCYSGRYHGGGAVHACDDPCSWRRRFFFTGGGGGGSRTRIIGRHGGNSSSNSARFSFSRFQNMGNFQRY